MSDTPAPTQPVEKIPSGIPGFDMLAQGGVPKGRTTLVAGTSGGAKTIFAAQFLAQGVRDGENVVFVTFEEAPEDIRRNMLPLGLDIAAWEAAGQWLFVDGAPQPEDCGVIGACTLEPLVLRIAHAARRCAARRLAIDSLGALLVRFPDRKALRTELHHILTGLKELDLTAVVTAERIDEYGPISRDGVEEFVSDNVVVLRHVLEHEVRNRTVEILKFRGTSHGSGERPFTVRPGVGISVVAPLAELATPLAGDGRITTGIPTLDEMAGGGLYRGSITLVSGPSGAGKTIIATSFALARDDERCLFITTEEGCGSLLHNTQSCGLQLAGGIAAGQVRLMALSPESSSLIDHLFDIEESIRSFLPQRLVIDSLSSLERLSNLKTYHAFVNDLANFARLHKATVLFTASSQVSSGDSVSDNQISSITDTIVLLRYVEMFGEIRRGLAILKVRGSSHDHGIREYEIGGRGVAIKHAFRNVGGILAGTPRHTGSREDERVGGLFGEGG